MTETFIDALRMVRRNMAGMTLIVLMAACLATLSGCASQGKNTVVVQSENQDTRVRVIVIHHTSEDFQGSLNILTKDSSRPVSSHYLVPEPGDPSYTDKKLKVYQLVPEGGRAWHAGASYWAGRTALNDMSVGIEIVNQTYCRNAEPPAPADEAGQAPGRICFFPDFPESQLAMVIELLKGITERHPEVKPTDIVGHSDIAPQRKIDPGPRFPWQRLYKLGFGAWYDDDTVVRYWQQFRQQLPPVLTLQTALHEYGYAIELSGVNDEQSQNVLRAFQMHFRPWLVNSEFDAETVAVLYALLEKYRPEKLGALLSMNAPAAQSEQTPVP